ncbi:GLPGLI family protein [Nonlabens antarcticus]|uniref:GLPGLI family protein n=1 Tax=Nonlabens antarcticus TaxID=392714 RepID=UPI001890EC91|nr:GLPGLI family protein [Nonlabens antarcticus]
MFKALTVSLLLNFSLSSIQAQTDFLHLDYELKVTYVPEIVNIRNTTVTISDDYLYYNVDYSPKSLGSLKDDPSIILLHQVNKKEYFSEILIERNKNHLIENRFDRRGVKRFLSINEDLPEMKWEITDETLELSGYKCFLAHLEFRGRKYEAYFTYDIPVTAGPWKFNGLPGLIVSIRDQTNTYGWTLKKINRVLSMDDKVEDFKERQKKFKNVSYKQFDQNRIEAKIAGLKIRKARSGSRTNSITYGFSTDQWLEPSNEYRSEINFSF